MSNYFVEPTDEDLILAHHGIIGQRWGFRRYQNPDGSLTDAGRKRYGSVENLRKIQDAKADAKAYKIRAKAAKKYNKTLLKANKQQYEQNKKIEEERHKEYRKRKFREGLLDNVLGPAASSAARNALVKISDQTLADFLTDDATKQIRKYEKEAQLHNAENANIRAKAAKEYTKRTADTYDKTGYHKVKDNAGKFAKAYSVGQPTNSNKKNYNKGKGPKPKPNP